MFFRNASPASVRTPDRARRIWIEELLGADLPRSRRQREALIAQLLSGGGADTFAALRGGIR